MECLDP